MGIVNEKNILRRKFKLIRDSSTEEERNNVTKNVEKYLRSYKATKNSIKHIGLYWPIHKEVDLRCLKEQYFIALPKCQSKKKLKYHFWDKSSFKSDLEGIPYPDNLYFIDYMELSMIFMPCLSIDREFYRLGYGGGYFDRLRADKGWNKVPAIGVLTSSCVSKDLLSRSEFDIPLSGYITDKEIVV